jgi:hypothetical protein
LIQIDEVYRIVTSASPCQRRSKIDPFAPVENWVLRG